MLWEKYKKALSKIFIDFAKKPIEKYFFLIIICYFHMILLLSDSTISSILHDFELKQQKNLENFSQI